MTFSPFSSRPSPSGASSVPDESFARLIVSPDGAVVYANRAFETLCGGERLSGAALQDLMVFRNSESAGETGLHLVFFPATKNSAVLQFDWVDTADGKQFLVASAQPGDAATTASLIPVMAETAETDDMAHFFTLSADLMATGDEDGYFTRVNPAMLSALNMTAERVSAYRLIDLLHPDDRAMAIPALQGILKADTQRHSHADFEARLISPEGLVRPVSWRIKRAGAHIIMTGRDVTDIRLLESRMIQHDRQLTEAEAIGHMGRWRWTPGDDRIEWSVGIYEIFGLSPDQFVPTLDSVNQYMPHRDAGRMMQAFQRAMISRTGYDIDFRVVRPNGEKRYVLCQGRCELDSDGDVCALYGIMQDVTAIRVHEKNLQAAKEEAERAYAARTQFLANMSHELRTPLNAVIGFSEMMERQLLGPLGNPKYVEYIRGIRESGEHLLDLITDILDMSKLEAGKYELAFEQINLAKTVRLALHMMEGRAVDQSIRLTATFTHEDRTIIADRRAVTQILLNLLSNAVKFSKAGGAVDVSCLERDGFCLIRVQDSGIGIPAHKIDVVTKPFEQVSSHYTREHEGTGLGLAITKELVERHGGTLKIESAINVGTTVTVRLPFDASKAAKKAA
jgi:two-component system cell cycle sensor histidine kinase PleC